MLVSFTAKATATTIVTATAMIYRLFHDSNEMIVVIIYILLFLVDENGERFCKR
jgi:hypothetical protein